MGTEELNTILLDETVVTGNRVLQVGGHLHDKAAAQIVDVRGTAKHLDKPEVVDF